MVARESGRCLDDLTLLLHFKRQTLGRNDAFDSVALEIRNKIYTPTAYRVQHPQMNLDRALSKYYSFYVVL